MFSRWIRFLLTECFNFKKHFQVREEKEKTVINRASLTKTKALEASKLLVVPCRKTLVVSEKDRRT